MDTRLWDRVACKKDADRQIRCTQSGGALPAIDNYPNGTVCSTSLRVLDEPQCPGRASVPAVNDDHVAGIALESHLLERRILR